MILDMDTLQEAAGLDIGMGPAGATAVVEGVARGLMTAAMDRHHIYAMSCNPRLGYHNIGAGYHGNSGMHANAMMGTSSYDRGLYNGGSLNFGRGWSDSDIGSNLRAPGAQNMGRSPIHHLSPHHRGLGNGLGVSSGRYPYDNDGFVHNRTIDEIDD